jgi:phosphate transport system permease protein
MDLSRRQQRQLSERAVKLFLMLCVVLTVATTVGITLVLFFESLRFFRNVGVFDFLTGTNWTALFSGPQQQFGVLPLVTGTVTIAVISALISLPLGLAAAIYLSEYANTRAKSILKPVLELLAGVPTIVYGFFALTYITPVLLKPLFNVGTFNGVSAGIAIGIMTLPMVASLSEDALSAVPGHLREAAFGLGATRLETSVMIVAPAALSGIVASFILAISRAIGETMIVAVASGSSPAGQTTVSGGLFDFTQSMQTMTGFIAYTFGSDVARGTTEFYSLFGVGLLLFLMTFAMNLISQWVTRRFRKVYE